MNTLGKILAVSIVGLAAGCSSPLSTVDSKLPKYDTSRDWYIDDLEAPLLIENEFDIDPKDGKLSDAETLKALDYLSTIPNNSGSTDNANYKDSRRALLDAMLNMRKTSNEKEKGTKE